MKMSSQDNQVKLLKYSQEKLNRGNWASKTEFILSCLGYFLNIEDYKVIFR